VTFVPVFLNSLPLSADAEHHDADVKADDELAGRRLQGEDAERAAGSSCQDRRGPTAAPAATLSSVRVRWMNSRTAGSRRQGARAALNSAT
jgi:hypothetical protein